MIKNLKMKVFIGILISILFFIINIDGEVKAVSLGEIEVPEEEKIMKYDAKTKQITEVDMEELEQVVATYKTSNGESSYKLNAYDPYKTIYSPKLAFTNNMRAALGNKVTDTSAFPYRTTCKVSGDLKADKVSATISGSASLVGPNIALTAAHVAFLEYDKEWYTFENLVFRPGYNGNANDENIDDGNYKGYSSNYEQIYFPSSYMINKDKQYDWALCVLTQPIGKYLGYFGLQHYDDPEELKQFSVTATGYPSQGNYGFNGRTQWASGGKIFETNDITFKFNALLFEGYSGGPVWRSCYYKSSYYNISY